MSKVAAALRAAASDWEKASYIEEPAFVALDVECWERNHSFVTEIGVSVLDFTQSTEVKTKHYIVEEQVSLPSIID